MYLTQDSYLHICSLLLSKYVAMSTIIQEYILRTLECQRRWSWGCMCHQLDGQKKTLNSTTTIVHSERKVMVNTTYHVYVRIAYKQSPHVHLHLSCHPRQFSSFVCNWCTFRGEKDNNKRHSTPPYDVVVNKTTLVHIICSYNNIYLHGLFCSGTNRSYSHPTSLLE